MENCLLLFHYSGGGQFSLKEYNRKICPLILIQGNLSAFQWWTVFADEDKGKDENRETCPQYTLSSGQRLNRSNLAGIARAQQYMKERILSYHGSSPGNLVRLRIFQVAAAGQYIEGDNRKFLPRGGNRRLLPRGLFSPHNRV